MLLAAGAANGLLLSDDCRGAHSPELHPRSLRQQQGSGEMGPSVLSNTLREFSGRMRGASSRGRGQRPALGKPLSQPGRRCLCPRAPLLQFMTC